MPGWRGELTTEGPSRRVLLLAVFKRYEHEISFVLPDAPEPADSWLLDDGTREGFHLVRVPLPNANSDTWSESNWAEALEAIAAAWDENFFRDLVPTFTGLELTRSEFLNWTEKCKYERPTFWGRHSDGEDEQLPLDNRVPLITITKIAPKTKKSEAAWNAINKLWLEGPPMNLATSDIVRKVNNWILKQPRERYPFSEVSRETIARLLNRK